MKTIVCHTLLSILLLISINPESNAQQITGTLTNLTPVKKIIELTLNSKEVSKEISAPMDGNIYIENISRTVVIKTWDEQKVKVSTTVHYEGESKLTDEEWFNKLNLSLKIIGSSIKIKSANLNVASYYSYNNTSGSLNLTGNGIAVYDGNGQYMGDRANIKRVLTITVPASSKLDIESKYANVSFPANVGDVTVSIANGNLEAENLNKLTIRRASLSNIHVGDVKIAEVDLTNGRFSAKNIDELDIETHASTIEIAYAKKVVMNSSNDEYELEEAGEVRGKKDFGSLHITKLNNSFEMNGSSADVKIRNLGPLVRLVRIDDRFANIRLPLKNTKNYSIAFTGAYSSVYGNFDKKEIPVLAEPTITSVGTLTNLKAVSGTLAPAVTGALIPGSSNNRTESRVTTLGTLNALTVNGVATSPVGRITNVEPRITSSGTLTSLTVVGTLSARTVPMSTVSGHLVAGTIEGGTFNANPSTIYRGGQLSQIAPAGNINVGMLRSFPGNSDTPSHFTASSGDSKGLKIDIKCPNCTVDFK